MAISSDGELTEFELEGWGWGSGTDGIFRNWHVNTSRLALRMDSHLPERVAFFVSLEAWRAIFISIARLHGKRRILTVGLFLVPVIGLVLVLPPFVRFFLVFLVFPPLDEDEAFTNFHFERESEREVASAACNKSS
jgi:hypothetical protein